MIAIQVDNLSKSYGFYRIFDDLCVSVPSGECFALFGPNGAGKTTLLRILATLQSPSSGQFTIFGKDGVKEKDAVRDSMMLIAHGSHLYEELNALENLRFALALRGLPPEQAAMKRALDQTGIGAFANLKVRQFSAGMKKRLALSKVLLAQPNLLLLDEPYNALDDAGTAMTNALIKDILSRDGTVFMTTHDRDKAVKVATRGGILKNGQLHLISQEQIQTDALF